MRSPNTYKSHVLMIKSHISEIFSSSEAFLCLASMARLPWCRGYRPGSWLWISQARNHVGCGGWWWGWWVRPFMRSQGPCWTQQNWVYDSCLLEEAVTKCSTWPSGSQSQHVSPYQKRPWKWIMTSWKKLSGTVTSALQDVWPSVSPSYWIPSNRVCDHVMSENCPLPQPHVIRKLRTSIPETASVGPRTPPRRSPRRGHCLRLVGQGRKCRKLRIYRHSIYPQNKCITINRSLVLVLWTCFPCVPRLAQGCSGLRHHKTIFSWPI
jgi:hypothetical protein